MPVSGQRRSGPALALALLAVLSAPVRAADFETGSVTLNRTLDSAPGNSAWRTVTLQGSYSAPPVVVAGPVTHANGHSLSVRIRNITTNNFQIALTSPCDSADADPNAAGNPCPPPAPGNSPPWATETVHYLVVPAGVWRFPDGTRIEAGRQNVSAVRSALGNTNAGEAVAFQHSYAGRPVLVHGVDSTGDPAWITSSTWGASRAAAPDATGFTVALEGAEAATAHGAETVGWVAIEPGNGTNNGHPYSAGVSAGLDVDRHDDGCFAQGTFSGFTATPNVVASHNTLQGTNGAWLRYCGPGVETTGINVHLDEDQVNDAERTGVPEAASWFAFAANGIGILVPAASFTPFFARDGFETYAAGSSVAGGADGAFWAGPWSAAGGAVEAVVDVSADPLRFENSGDLIDGGERALRFSGNNNSAATRDLAQSITDPVVYAAMLIRFEGTQNDNDFLALWFENNGFGTAPNFGIKMNRGDGSGPEDLFGRSTTNAVYDTDLENGRTYLLIARIEKSASDSYDRVSIWVDPGNLGNATAPPADAQSSVAASGVSAFDSIGFRVVNLDSGDQVTVDELRLGTSWAEVTAPNVLPAQGGRLSIDTQADPVFRSIALNGFDVAPVVLALGTSAGSGPAAVRVRAVSASSFQIAPVEPPAADGPHETLEIDYVALGEIAPGERKLYLIGSAEFAELGRHDTRAFQSKFVGGGGGWDALGYLGRQTVAPVIGAVLQSMNNETGNPPQGPSVPWLTTAVRAVSDSGFEMALERSESSAGTLALDETVGLVIVPDGAAGTLVDNAGSTVAYQALRSADAIGGAGNGCFSSAFASAFAEPPIVVANKNSRDGVDGGWLRRCDLSASAVGLHVEEDQDNDAERNHTTEVAGILAFSGFALAVVDHYAIAHDGAGVTCLAEPVTISPHDAAHAAIAPGAVTLTLTTSTGKGDWSAVLAGGGVLDNGAAGDGAATYQLPDGETAVTLALNYTDVGAGSAETFHLGVSDGSAADLGDGDPEDPALTFARTGFRFLNETEGSTVIGTQIAGKSSATAPDARAISLQAVRSADEDPSVCAAAFADGQLVTVELGGECRDPALCAGSAVSVGNDGAVTAIATSTDDGGAGAGAYTPVPLRFGADARAALELAYPDAGAMQLHARYAIPLDDASATPSGDFMTGASNTFVVRPFAFAIESADADFQAQSGGVPDNTGSVFRAAGAPFTVTVRAVPWQAADDADADGQPDPGADLGDNGTTANFGNEAVPAPVTLGHALAAPSGGAGGALGGDTALAGFVNGQASAVLSFSEVGIIDLDAMLAGYLGGGQSITGQVANVGRFVPHRFTVAANTPVFDDGCPSGDFTYQDQLFHYAIAPVLTVTARNSAGTVTANYGGSGGDRFWKLASALAGRSYTDTSGAAAVFAATLDTDATLAGDTDFDGQGTITLDEAGDGDRFVYARANPEAPFNAAVDLAIPAADLTDSDGVCHDAGDDGGCDGFTITGVSGTELRYGRLRLINAGGSELIAVQLPLRIEHFDGTAFVTNTADDCTALTLAADLELANPDTAGGAPQPGDSVMNVGAGTSQVTSGDVLFAAGQAALLFSAPGENNTGFIDVRADLDGADLGHLLEDRDGNGLFDAADNPLGRATFGIFRGADPIIYTREPW